MIGQNHPQVYKLVAAMIKEQGLTERNINDLDNGRAVPLFSKRKYKEHNRHLRQIITDYNTYTPTQFLERCSYHFTL